MMRLEWTSSPSKSGPSVQITSWRVFYQYNKKVNIMLALCKIFSTQAGKITLE